MKKIPMYLLSMVLILLLAVSAAPNAAAYEIGEAYQKDLSIWIQDEESREYVEMMLDYHLRTNKDVQNALEGGFAAVFLFDGCSDHMNDPDLSDLSYYRVSGVCVVIKLDAFGEPRMIYFNNNCSTIPDRPLEYGAWSLPEVGKVGPATVCDGTYQLYSVYHKGKYEALHARSDYWDGTLEAIYMTPEGYTSYRANEINIHTRTSNHTSGVGMWSAGCPLVGDGDQWEFWKLIYAAYYTTYDSFEVGNFVGTLTIDRQALRTELYTLYKDPDAVDAFLTNTRQIQPETYLAQCADVKIYEKTETMRTAMDTDVMTLPCSNATDARSRTVAALEAGQKVTVVGSIQNALGNQWYQVECGGESGYIYSGHLEDLSWFARIWNSLFG